MNLDFLATTDEGWKIPGPAEEDAQSEVSEWELWEREERIQKPEELGAVLSAEEK